MAVQSTSAIFGECKWRNMPIDMEIVTTLMDRGELFQYSEKYYMLFSKTGFTQTVIDYAKDRSKTLKLVSFTEICRLGDK